MSIYAKTNMEAVPGSCTECKYGDRYGCVGDVKCRILQKYFTGNVELPYKERPDECPLVEQLEPPNDPLTVYELRNMTGQPVYLKTLGEDFDDGWYIVGGIDKVRLHCLYLYSLLWLEHYGKTWMAYRYPPKGEE